MARADHIILVTGVTGRQGGAVTRHLLEDGWSVRALVRHPDKASARAAAEQGVELVVGDLRDRTLVDAAVKGAYGVYSMQSLGDGPDAEQTEGRNLADAAAAAQVTQIVYSSVMGADRPSPLMWVGGKHELEAYMRSLDLPLTIFRPATFMENLLGQKAGILEGRLELPEPATYSHQRIAVDDIGRFVALAFREPENWLGTATEIAGDESTGPEAAAAFSQVLGTDVQFVEVAPPEGMPPTHKPGPDEPAPNRADVPALRRALPELKTLAEWAADLHERGAL